MSAETGAGAYAVESEASTAFTTRSITALRRKLLDLTTRNPLIAFKHPDRARRYVRVIDELPDELLNRLSGEAGMKFKSLGRKSTEPEDEKTVQFRRALAAAKLEDPQYLKQLEGAGPEAGEKTLDRLEDELRQRLREQLGMPARKAADNISAADIARRAGLNPSFDLPVTPPEGKSEGRHTDNAIQTLLFEDDMQATLGRMREAARLSVDETGVNPVFCVFGFLEWYEDAHSETPLFAPLLLAPLSIDRKLVRGQYQYFIKSTGEEPQLNVAIVERLKRDFELTLPPLEEGMTPEQYLLLAQQTIEQMKGWKIRRWITIGLFSFARIAMYHDLAPENWAGSGGLEQHAGIRRLLQGGSGSGSDGASADSEDAHAAVAELQVPLITDADSSQLAAIRDVLTGRNLVIEGPPGTGKSQTITNLIAAALAEGKTVLFLAEKMAALNVVKDRLSHGGLGDFCIELHSTKAGRKETAEALSHRLRRANARDTSADLDAALRRLEELRQQLGRCVEALSQPAGRLGITAQQLLWRCDRARDQSAGLPSELDEITLPNAENLTEIDTGRLVAAIDHFEKAYARAIAGPGSIAAHPWYGVASAELDPIRAEDVVRRVRRLSETAGQAAASLDNVAAQTGVRLERLADMAQVTPAKHLTDPPAGARDDLIARLADPQTLATAEAFARQLREYAQVRTAAVAAFTSEAAADACNPADLQTLIDAAGTFASARVGDLNALQEKRSQQAAAWQTVVELVTKAARRANWAEPLSPPAERALVAGIDLAAAATPQVLRSRTPAAMESGASDMAKAAVGRATTLKARREELSAKLNLAAPPPPAELREHAKRLRTSSFFSFLSSAWRAARKTYLGLARQQDKTPPAAMAATLDALAAYQDEAAAMANDAKLTALAGSATSVDFDFAPVLAAAEWADRVRTALPAGEEVHTHLRRLLFEAPGDTVEAFGALASDPQIKLLRQAIATDAARQATTAQQAAAVAKAAERARTSAEAAARLNLRENVSLGDAQTLRAHLERMLHLRDSLDRDEATKQALGQSFAGHRTPPEPMEASCAHVRQVESLGLPADLRGWVLAGEAASRSTTLRELGGECAAAAAAVDAAWADLTSIAPVDLKQWLAVDSLGQARAVDVRDHARRCAEDPAALQLLIDERRARRDVDEDGLTPILDLLEAKRAPLKNLSAAARRVIAQSIARAVIARHPALANFTGDRYEAYRREFRDLDHQLKRFRQQAIARALSQRSVDPGSDAGSRKTWTGRALIENEADKQRGHVSVRSLLDRGGRAIQQLMPCFMMSPLSVAQYLRPGGLTFDLVIMDEASQLRPEDAIGAIARGNQLVVVGDPKQLPPTNFFRGADGTPADDDEEAETTAADEQSILDQALGIMRPARRLKWHYRSRHASLIAFSNKEFYDSQLVVFPSPYHDHADYGVSYVHIPDGVLRSRMNVPEARTVAQAALDYARRHPDRSLGIVTLNQPQAELLTAEIDRMAAENEDFEAWRQKCEASLEPFFVKNLENVQGDERDAIFVSTVFGPDEPGKREFAQRFGPINNAGGHRRLNVLFTRAKCQTVVFSSMDPADLRTNETSPWGVRALKGYLKFAKDGDLNLAQETGRAPDSDFEVAVMEALQAAGHEVVPQVGVMGYFIDIAVRHPQRAGEYVLGIECDGATYHSTKSARDRDRLRQEILERLKWRIHRIWSLDWYRSPAREKERLLAAIKQALAGEAAV